MIEPLHIAHQSCPICHDVVPQVRFAEHVRDHVTQDAEEIQRLRAANERLRRELAGCLKHIDSNEEQIAQLDERLAAVQVEAETWDALGERGAILAILEGKQP